MSNSLQLHRVQLSCLSATSQSLLTLMATESVMPSNHLILCHPLLLLPSILPSIRVFPNELAFHIRWPKNWSFSFSVRTFDEYSGLISFRTDWFDFIAVQGTLKSLLQQHSIKASILQCSTFCMVLMVQLSHPYMTTGKTIALTGWTFVGKVMCLLFITVSGFAITFLPRRVLNPSSILQWSQFGPEKLYEFPKITQQIQIKPALEARSFKDSLFFLVQNIAFLTKDKNIMSKVGILPRQPLLRATLQEKHVFGVLLWYRWDFRMYVTQQ